jgi:hypothetical protein
MDELRLRVFVERVRGKIFRPTRDEIEGDWRRILDKE